MRITVKEDGSLIIDGRGITVVCNKGKKGTAIHVVGLTKEQERNSLVTGFTIEGDYKADS